MTLQKRWLTSCLAALMATSVGWAQQDSQRDRDRQQQSDRSSETDQQRDRRSNQQDDQRRREQRDSESERRSESQQHNDQDARKRISPAGWIRVATDYDNDGRFDAVETLYVYDLEKARQSSRDRANSKAREMDRSNDQRSDARTASRDSDRQVPNRTSQYRDDRGSADSQRSRSGRSQSSGQQQETVAGKLLQLRYDTFAGMNEESLLAKVRTEDNRSAKVYLGQRTKLRDLQLQEGDQVEITGVKGRINDRPMLFAKQVSSGGKSVQVDLTPSKGTKRVRGEVISTRTAQFRNRDQAFVVAKVRCPNDSEKTVNLGQKSQVDKLNLSAGDQVMMLVRPARVNGQPAMVADQIHANGKTVVHEKRSSANQRSSREQRQTDGDRQRRGQGEAGARGGDDNRSDRQQSDRAKMRDQQREQQDRQRQQRERSAASENQALLGVAVADSDDGVLIVAVHPESPAAEKDLKVGDRILSINGQTIESAEDVVRIVRDQKPQDQIKIRTKRDDSEQTVQVKLWSRSAIESSR